MTSRFWQRALTLPLGLTLAIAGFSMPDAFGAGYSATAKHFPAGKIYKIDSANNRLAATNSALTQCRSELTGQQGYCDLIDLGGQKLHTTQALKAKVPSGRYPLYLWRFEKADSVVYLAGSIHLLKPGFYPLPRQYIDAFNATDSLVLEVDTEKLGPLEVQQKSLQYGSLPPNQTLESVLPIRTYAALEKILLEYGAPISHFQQFKPNLVTQQLALFALLSVGYNPEIGLENHFRSKAKDKTVLELESFDFQLDLLLNVPMETQVEMANTMLEQMNDFEAFTADLVSAWLRGDDEAFLKVSQAQQGETKRLRTFHSALIEKRNHSMADTVVGYLSAGGRYFVLAGALHLIGEKGIPNLLLNAGYVGRRIYSDQTIPPATPNSATP